MSDTLGFLIFLAVILTVTGSGHYYLYRRLARDTARTERRRRIGGAVILGLWLFLLGTPFLAELGLVPMWLKAPVWGWMGAAFYLLLALLVGDFVRLALRLSRMARAPSDSATEASRDAAADSGEAPAPPSPHERRLFLERALAGGAVATAASVTAHGVWRAYAPPVVTELPIVLPNLPRVLDGLTIAQLTDIHVDTLIERRFMEETVRRVNALSPDLVAITGDMVDGRVSRLGPFVSPLHELRSRFGTYFVNGNHEYYSGDVEWTAALEAMGVNVLRNRHVTLGDVGGRLDLVGVDDWRGGDGRRWDLDAAIAGRDPDRASVLLAHQPEGFRQAAERGLGLQLSGHTHGGQMWPFNFVVDLAHEFMIGRFELGASQLYVSRGTGFWGPPLRVGVPPEIVKVVLLAG